MWLRHLQLWFQQAECDVEAYKCDCDPHESDYDTYHSCKCRNHICAYQNHTAFGSFTPLVETTLCVWQLHSACRNHTQREEISPSEINHTRACVHHSMSVNITFVSVIITLIRVNIALCVYKTHSCVLISPFAFQNYTRACNFTLSHYASEHFHFFILFSFLNTEAFEAYLYNNCILRII
jgi:hypothetical protein